MIDCTIVSLAFCIASLSSKSTKPVPETVASFEEKINSSESKLEVDDVPSETIVGDLTTPNPIEPSDIPTVAARATHIPGTVTLLCMKFTELLDAIDLQEITPKIEAKTLSTPEGQKMPKKSFAKRLKNLVRCCQKS